ncbi:MAG: type IV toxin-antitoxin system AbiEi family antitoxin domain-containing protein [Endomicrobiales bacterium]
MDRQTEVKLNLLLRSWPRRTVAVSSYLHKQGIYRQLVSRYEQSGWIKSIGHGAFVRGDDERVSWAGGLYAIQEQLGLPIHLGGKSALEQSGYAHFIPVRGIQSVWLYGAVGVKVPAWFRHAHWDITVHFTASGLIRGYNANQGFTGKVVDGCMITISSPERAILELLDMVPADQTFEEAHQIMESLNALRPKIVSTLLDNCGSVKVKRLFLFLAEYCKHPWLKYIDRKGISMGSGKRYVVKNGCFDSKYQITVPREFKQ